MDISTVRFEKPEELNFILGQSHFIKTVEDLHEALVQSSPSLKFGIAFCESSGPRLVRWSGNDQELIDLAVKNAHAIGAGHAFVVLLKDGFPINVLNAIKALPEGCTVYCATATRAAVGGGQTERGPGPPGGTGGGA